MSKIYGFCAGTHDSTIAYVEDGEIKCVIQEERIKRIKSGNDYPSNPTLAKKAIEKETGVNMVDADFITCTTPVGYEFIKEENLPSKGIRSFNHHYCHAVGAYMCSGFKGKALVWTTDGGGDGLNGTLWLCEDGKMELVKKFYNGLDASISQMWQSATAALGWKPLKDEGKVMGMAGHGRYNEFLYSNIEKLFNFNFDTLDFYSPGNHQLCHYLFEEFRKLGWAEGAQNRYDLAYNVQEYTNNMAVKIIRAFAEKYPEYAKQMCFAGGLFANVKMNQKINELDEVNEMFVFPAMGDDGLAVGSAIALAKELGEWTVPKRLPNMFFGLSYTDEEIAEEAKNYEVTCIDYDPNIVVDHLEEGQIGAFFKGKFEHGPRALGARSIIVKTTDRATHELLNTRLNRHEVMPFAPMILKDKAGDVFHGAEKSSYAAEFMTLCYTAKDEWVDKIPACIHSVDNTGRPQFVNPETNPHWYNLLDAYYQRTGIPALLNTSFNGHGEPIVNTPSQAFEHLKSGAIDFLIMENKIYYRK